MWKLPRPRGQFVAGALALVVLASATLAGCGDNDRLVKVVEPAQGATVNAGDIRVAVGVKDFDVVDKIGQAPKDGEGHINYYMDAGEIPTEDGKAAVTADNRSYHAQASEDQTWPNVSVGKHTFAVQLVNNDNTPLKPPVIAQVTVSVRPASGTTIPPRSSATTAPSETSPPVGETTAPATAGAGTTQPPATTVGSTTTATRPSATPTP